jgi:hypothetical protein
MLTRVGVGTFGSISMTAIAANIRMWVRGRVRARVRARARARLRVRLRG